MKSEQGSQLSTAALGAQDNHRKACAQRAPFLFVNYTIIKILVTSNLSSIACINKSAL